MLRQRRGGATVTISNNVIGGSSPTQGNTAACQGGGIFCECVAAAIDSNLIENNFCTDSAGTMGGGLSVWNCPGAFITNNIFAYNLTNGAANDPDGGGAIYALSSGLVIVNNTFVCNSSAGPTGVTLTPKAYGGAIQIDGYDPYAASLVNNIFYSNVAYNGNSVAFTYRAPGRSPTATRIPTAARIARRQAANIRSAPAVSTKTLCFISSRPAHGASRSRCRTAGSPSPLLGVGASPPANGVPNHDFDGNARPGPDNETDMGAYQETP